MALIVLRLRKKLNDAQKKLEALREMDAEFEKREAELEKSIEEAQSEEDSKLVDEEIEKFESEKAAHAEEKEKLEAEVRELEESLAAEEAAQETNAPAEAPVAETKEEKREGIKTMSMRAMMFGKNEQERSAFFEREEVKAYLGEVRAAMKEKRALSNVGLTIPEVFLGILRENLMNYSKLYKHVNVKPLSGDGRMVIQGTIPEAVWTECCANLNELDLVFNDVEVGCNKVAGFFAICNAVLEDSDVDLAAELMTALGQSIGLALDKAILYGTGNHMPLGIVTRLAQTSQPASYPATARTWVDLHTSNIKTIANSVTGIALFQAFMINSAAAKGKYSRGEKVWVMNELTYNWMMAQSMSIDASGAIVAGVNGRMPVVGGIIEVLDFVPNYVIVGGYMDLYLLAERSGQKFAQSEHVRFLGDQTVFKGTARYDGQPAIAEGFVAIGVNGAEPSDSMSFAGDTANSVQGVKISKTTATVADGATVQLKAETYPVKGSITWASSDTTYATVDTNGKVTGEAQGSAIITATCGDFSASCEVTVTA
ncbi:MAG: phage major capsid protein [Lachnospiraceae bacterium]|nr:phage major capsid protein [Lachnospiraceae bacterium]